MNLKYIDAGDFKTWLTSEKQNVPCGSCTACCTSSYFKIVGPEETETLKHIPVELRFYSPGLNPGSVLIGYDENGHCSMLKNNQCTIYEHRPKTCRDFDCRVFAASGLEVEEDDKQLIAKRVKEWKFSFNHPEDKLALQAIKKAVKFIETHMNEFEHCELINNTTHISVLATKIYIYFLNNDTDEAKIITIINQKISELID